MIETHNRHHNFLAAASVSAKQLYFTMKVFGSSKIEGKIFIALWKQTYIYDKIYCLAFVPAPVAIVFFSINQQVG